MESTIPNHVAGGKTATRQAKTFVCIIIGCQRLHTDWADALAIACNGAGYVRDGRDLRLIHSEAFEQTVRS